MSKCIYKIKGLNHTFQSELELNDYLIKNRLNKVPVNAYMFSLTSKAKETSNRVENLGKNTNSKNLMGTTQLLDMEHYTDEKDALGVPIKKLFRPKYDKASRIEYSLPMYIKKISLQPNDKMTIEQKAMAALDLKIDQEDQMKEVGTLYHRLVHAMIKGQGPFTSNSEYQKILNLFESVDKDGNLKYEGALTSKIPVGTTIKIKENINSEMKKIWSYFDNTYIKKGGNIYSEVTIKTTEPKLEGSDGLIGRMDVLGVSSDGNVNVYDFKLSTDLFEN